MLAANNQPGERFWHALFGKWRGVEAANREQARPLIERFGLDHMADEYAGTLSGGQRKLLEMARALMVEPELILLDEPTAGVNPALTQELLEHIKALRDLGMTVIFIEHDMDAVQNISDWVVCMAQGRIIAEGPPADVAANPAVIDAYLGSHHGEAP
jgi:branched-chain amino acid transport system ATP-binding protein